MLEQKTHREVKNPQISARYLADYMAASERKRRSIIRDCKYQPRARVIQHDEAKTIIANFIYSGRENLTILENESIRIRERLVDSEFERDLCDHNADYIDRFAEIYNGLQFPNADILSGGVPVPIQLNGVKVNVEIQFRLRRLTKTNKVKIGAGVLRYAKGKALPSGVGDWQAAFLFGYLSRTDSESAADPEQKLCLAIDAYAGTIYPAPSDSISRFQNMEAACASIAERWDNVEPPANAVL